MMRLRLFKGRAARRAHEKSTRAALVVQRRWRNRRAAQLSGLSDIFANLALASHKDHKLEQQAREEAERKAKEREEAAHRRNAVLRRRWAALRSCLHEVKTSIKAATMVQCLVRAHHARRLLKIRARDKKVGLKAISGEEAVTTAHKLQHRLRAHQAATALLVDQYDKRTEWYADSRLAPLLEPLAAAVARLRRGRRAESRELRRALEAAAAAAAAAAGRERGGGCER